jgi:signal peptidase I
MTYARTGMGIRYGVEPTLVPEGHFFVLGDNTLNSYDSRYWGFVPKEEFIGCPFFPGLAVFPVRPHERVFLE